MNTFKTFKVIAQHNHNSIIGEIALDEELIRLFEEGYEFTIVPVRDKQLNLLIVSLNDPKTALESNNG